MSPSTELMIKNNIFTVDLSDHSAVSTMLNQLIEIVSDIEVFNRHIIHDIERENDYFSFCFKNPANGTFYDIPDLPKHLAGRDMFISNEQVFFQACVNHGLSDQVAQYLDALLNTLHLTSDLAADALYNPAGYGAFVPLAMSDQRHLSLVNRFVKQNDHLLSHLTKQYGFVPDLLLAWLVTFYDEMSAIRGRVVHQMQSLPDFDALVNESPPQRFYDAFIQYGQLKYGRAFAEKQAGLLATFHRHFNPIAPQLFDYLYANLNAQMPTEEADQSTQLSKNLHHIEIQGGLTDQAGVKAALERMLTILSDKAMLEHLLFNCNDQYCLDWHFYHVQDADGAPKLLGEAYHGYAETFFTAAVRFDALRPLVLAYGRKLVRFAERFGALPYSEEDYAGSFAFKSLVLADLTFLPEYIRFLRTNDLSHEVHQSAHIRQIVGAHGLCEPILDLIAFRLTAGGQHADEDMAYIEEVYQLSNYLKASEQHITYFVRRLSQNFWLAALRGGDFNERNRKAAKFTDIEWCVEELRDASVKQSICDLTAKLHPCTEPLQDQLLDYSQVVVYEDNNNVEDRIINNCCIHSFHTGHLLSGAALTQHGQLLLVEAHNHGRYVQLDLSSGDESVVNLTGDNNLPILNIAASVSDDTVVVIQNYAIRQRTLSVYQQGKLAWQKQGPYDHAHISTDGQRVLGVGSNEDEVWDDKPGYDLFTADRGTLVEQLEVIRNIGHERFSDQGSYVACTDIYGLQVFSRKNGELINHVDKGSQFAFAPDEQHLVVADGRNLIKYALPSLLDVHFVKGVLPAEEAAQLMCFSPDGKFLIMAGHYGGASHANICAADTLHFCCPWVVSENHLVNMFIDTEQQQLVFVDCKGLVKVYCLKKLAKEFESLPDITVTSSLQQVVNDSILLKIPVEGPIEGCTVWNGTLYFSLDEVLCAFDLKKERLTELLEVDESIVSIDMKHDGKQLLLACIGTESGAQVFSVEPDTLTPIWQSDKNGRHVTLLPKLNMIAIADESNQLLIANYLTGELVAKHRNINNELRGLITTQDESVLIGCHYSSDDSAIYFWDTQNWQQYRAKHLDSKRGAWQKGFCTSAHHMALNHDHTLVAAVDHTQLGVYQVSDGARIESLLLPDEDKLPFLFSPDVLLWSPCQQYLVVVSEGEIFIFDRNRGCCLEDQVYSISTCTHIRHASFDAQGKLLTIVTRDEIIRLDWQQLLEGKPRGFWSSLTNLLYLYLKRVFKR